MGEEWEGGGCIKYGSWHLLKFQVMGFLGEVVLRYLYKFVDWRFFGFVFELMIIDYFE